MRGIVMQRVVTVLAGLAVAASLCLTASAPTGAAVPQAAEATAGSAPRIAVALGERSHFYQTTELPNPPAGEKWLRVAAFPDLYESKGFSVMLLDSAGKLASVGHLASVQRQQIERIFPDTVFADISTVAAVDTLTNYNLLKYLLLPDGQIINAWKLDLYKDLPAAELLTSLCRAPLPKLPGGVTYVKMLAGPDVVLRSDGRVAIARTTHLCDELDYPSQVLPVNDLPVVLSAKGANLSVAASSFAVPASAGIRDHIGQAGDAYGIAVAFVDGYGNPGTQLVTAPAYVQDENYRSPQKNKRNLAVQISAKDFPYPKLKTSYVAVTNAGFGLAMLRSDGKVFYRGLTQYKTDPPQPPQPPKGLKYTNIHYRYSNWDMPDFETEARSDYRTFAGKLTLERSDGALMAYQCAKHSGGIMSKCVWRELTIIPKGWRPLPELTGNGQIDAYVLEPFTNASKAVVTVTGITTKTIKPSRQSQWPIWVTTTTRAKERGEIRISYKGKIIGRTKATNKKAKVLINTNNLPRGKPLRISVQTSAGLTTKASRPRAFHIVLPS
jgi:hypothetical protein